MTSNIIITLFFSLIAIVFISSSIVWAGVAVSPNAWNTGWRINDDTGIRHVNYNNGSYQGVLNDSAHDYFIPTKTVAEMNAFCNNADGVDCCGDLHGGNPWRGDFETGSPPSSTWGVLEL